MYTEEEAKTKWCPFNKGYWTTGSYHCMGSDCMMWKVIENLATECIDCEDFACNCDKENGEVIGYCGLTGK